MWIVWLLLTSRGRMGFGSFWRDEFCVGVTSYSHNHIDARIGIRIFGGLLGSMGFQKRDRSGGHGI